MTSGRSQEQITRELASNSVELGFGSRWNVRAVSTRETGDGLGLHKSSKAAGAEGPLGGKSRKMRDYCRLRSQPRSTRE